MKFCTRVFGGILSLFGVITSSCGSMPCDYGVEPVHAVVVQGMVRSDTTAIEGIRLQILSMDSSQVYSSSLSGHMGSYYLSSEEKPDSILITATDVDGEANGLYLPAETFRATDPEKTEEEFVIDFNLIPDG